MATGYRQNILYRATGVTYQGTTANDLRPIELVDWPTVRNRRNTVAVTRKTKVTITNIKTKP